MVGNNTPIFFVRDRMKFPDFIHSQKRLPDSGTARRQHAVGLLDPLPRVGPPGRPTSWVIAGCHARGAT